MSCQQVSRLITASATTSPTAVVAAAPLPPTTTTTTGTITLEDPYVFTETVPNTPPILFAAQKSRPRLGDTPGGTSVTTIAATTTIVTAPSTKTIVNQKLPLTQQNGNATKAALATAALGNVTIATNLKTIAQSQLRKQSAVPKRSSPNVCVVRPQQQFRQRQQQQQRQEPPPILQHTPSLWQTPLLLEPAPAKVLVAPSAPAAHSPRISSLQPSSAAASTPPPLTVVTTPSLSPTAAITMVTATAMVSPLMPTAAVTTLPPSKFHHTTLAQHLQKVECLRKPKKPLANATAPINAGAAQLNPSDKPAMVVAAAAVAPPLQAIEAPQHSEPDLNDIPVNVIFRKPQNSAGDVAGNIQTAVAANGKSACAKPTVSSLEGVSAAQAKSREHNLSTIEYTAPTSKAESPASTPTKDIVFVQPLAKSLDMSATLAMSSMVMPTVVTNGTAHVIQPAPYNQPPMKQNMAAPLCGVTPKASVGAQRKTPPTKRKSINKMGKLNGLSPATYKKGRKCITAAIATLLTDDRTKFMRAASSSTTAVAVVQVSEAELDADISLLATATVLPYCVQRHWLSVHHSARQADGSAATIAGIGREDRIALHKGQLRRQALQLLTTHSLQRLPQHTARRRLVCVDRLLRKYHSHSENSAQPATKCMVEECPNRPLDMAVYCQKHILLSSEQLLFMPCAVKFSDSTQCQKPVFDITHALPLCGEHAKEERITAYSAGPHNTSKLLSPTMSMPVKALAEQHQQPPVQMAAYKKIGVEKPLQVRKRKVGGTGNPVGRPQKRARKSPIRVVPATLPPLSAVLQRKSSTTSLESIASNSYSSSSQPPALSLNMSSSSLPPPALAPLSGLMCLDGGGIGGGSGSAISNYAVSPSIAAHLKEHEINEIVTQLTMVANNNNSNSSNNNSNHIHDGYNMNHHQQKQHNLGYTHFNLNSNSNFTSGLGSSPTLPSCAEDLLTQDMLSICENSSAYASSEDTGLGGLSESELLPGPHDADEIPLGDPHLLEEHDFVNVLSSLQVDAFNELFTVVRQDERDEVERALELADKHLKSLQQTIGSESDFLGDLLDVNDDILTDTDMCSKMEMH